MISIESSPSNSTHEIDAVEQPSTAVPGLYRTLVAELERALRAAAQAERCHRNPKPIRTLYETDRDDGA